MNGALYPQPQGLLMDPRMAALANMGMGLLSASGPSLTPVSLGQSLGQAGMMGLQAFQQAHQAQQQEAFRQAQMKRMEEQLQLQREEAARKANMPITAGPGTQLFRPGESSPFYTVPFKPEPTPPPRPPMTRTVQRGTETVTEEFVDGQWKEIGRGPKFQPPRTEPTAQPKPPTGFRWKADSPGELEPIPGGPKDTAPKDAARAQGAIQKANIVIGKVDEALKQVGFFSTGLTGSLLGMVPGTGAFDLDKTIDTIKANLGFTELQAMREASPTGGALGQVAIQELAMLQSTVASLEKGQSEDNLKRGLQQVKTHFENWKKAVMEANKQTNTTSFPTPNQDAVNRLRMNPKEKELFDQVFGPGAAARVLGR